MGFGMERAVGLSENLRRGENERVFFHVSRDRGNGEPN
jgi:hypothetical protein